MKNRNYRSVYSTDPKDAKACRTCGEAPCECPPIEPLDPPNCVAKIRLETKGRGGKAVSVVFNLPHNPEALTKLTKKMKSFCGSGGTYKEGTIEIQGDHRQKIKTFLEKAGFQVKLAGG